MVLAPRLPLSYNALHQPTVLAIAQRLPAAFFQGESALNSSRQRRLCKTKVAGRNSFRSQLSRFRFPSRTTVDASQFIELKVGRFAEDGGLHEAASSVSTRHSFFLRSLLSRRVYRFANWKCPEEASREAFANAQQRTVA